MAGRFTRPCSVRDILKNNELDTFSRIANTNALAQTMKVLDIFDNSILAQTLSIHDNMTLATKALDIYDNSALAQTLGIHDNKTLALATKALEIYDNNALAQTLGIHDNKTLALATKALEIYDNSALAQTLGIHDNKTLALATKALEIYDSSALMLATKTLDIFNSRTLAQALHKSDIFERGDIESSLTFASSFLMKAGYFEIEECSEFTIDEQYEIDLEINELRSDATAKEINLLSNNSKAYLSKLCEWILQFTLFYIAFDAGAKSTTEIQEELINAKNEILIAQKKNDLQISSELKEIKRLQKSFNSKQKSAVKECRFITLDGLNVMAQSNKKSDSITQLSLGDLVRIIDSSNKSWLLIQGEKDGDVFKGWIYRRYTKYGPGC